jgi:hypothetical protein
MDNFVPKSNDPSVAGAGTRLAKMTDLLVVTGTGVIKQIFNSYSKRVIISNVYYINTTTKSRERR